MAKKKTKKQYRRERTQLREALEGKRRQLRAANGEIVSQARLLRVRSAKIRRLEGTAELWETVARALAMKLGGDRWTLTQEELWQARKMEVWLSEGEAPGTLKIRLRRKEDAE